MKKILLLLFFPLYFSYAQYVPGSQYLQSPEKCIGYVDSCAKFWKKAYDPTYGGFYMNIDQMGNLITSWGTNKNSLNESRDAYGFTRAFQLTGDTSYLRYARYALSFLTRSAWDTVHQGWYNAVSRTGSPSSPNDAKTAYYQHYALVGLVANYEATRDSAIWNWIQKSYNYNDTYLWDSSPSTFGYYDNIQSNGTSPSAKSFNATVDAVTTHLLHLYLMTGDSKYKTRLLQVADNMVNRLAASVPQQQIGFVELYTTNWQPDNSQTMTIMGHVLKTAWCLARIYEIQPDTVYLNTAKQLIEMVLTKGYDHQLGGPYKDFDRTTGQMLMWGQVDTAKAWWQMEQAITSGLYLYHITADSKYLQMADETISFFMRYFVDHIYGEVFSDRTRYGGQIWGLEKGGDGKAGYHSIELGYYSYIYGKLFFKHEPITLNYDIQPTNQSRILTMKPIECPDGELSITNINLNGGSYFDYDGSDLTLNVPAGTGGIFTVTYELNAPAGVTATVNYASNWNLISLPVQLNDRRKSVLYPDAISSAFSFNNDASYQVQDTLLVGKGYWIKFGSPTVANLTGLNVDSEAIPVSAGWNLIGTVNSIVPVETITSIPGGLVTSDFFGYDHGYTTTPILEPGKGYWVKVNSNGKLLISSPSVAKSKTSERIHIVTSNELPPPAPGELNVNDPTIPTQYALEQNYPNPFNPTTTFGFQIAKPGMVTLKIYNMLGEEVASIVNENLEPGTYNKQWTAGSMPSGVYYYRLSAGSYVDVKKLVLMK